MMTSPHAPKRIILWGLGVLGSYVLEGLGDRVKDLQIVGAVDNAESLRGRKLCDAFPHLTSSPVVIRPDLATALQDADGSADAVLHMTQSEIPIIQPQLNEAMGYGLNVLTASEVMFYPGLRHPEAADALDAAATRNGVSLSGAGVNPGFSFDSLILAMGRASARVDYVSSRRVVNVTGTGPLDVQHVGFGLWPEEFRAKVTEGSVTGHMGLPESVAAVGERLGLPLDRIDESWTTYTSEEPTDSGSSMGMLEPGRVVGIVQEGGGFVAGRQVISFSEIMFYEPERFGYEQLDEVNLKGHHELNARLNPSPISLVGAAAVMINSVHELVRAGPGLHQMLDFSLGGRCRGGFTLARDPDRPSDSYTTYVRQRPL